MTRPADKVRCPACDGTGRLDALDVPQELDNEEFWRAYSLWCASRQEMTKRAPFTPTARRIAVSKAAKAFEAGWSLDDICEQFIRAAMSGWRGVFFDMQPVRTESRY